MAENTSRLAALRRLDSADKARRVLAALDTTLGTGEPLTIAALARRARVSRRFIYDHPELRAEAERLSAQAAGRHAADDYRQRPGHRRVAARRPRQRQGRQPPPAPPSSPPCASASASSSARTRSPSLGHATTGTSAASDGLAQLEQELFEAGEELAQRTEELQAARQINRELISRLNREHR